MPTYSFFLILGLTFPLGYIALELVYHRSLSHQALKLNRLIRNFFVLLALPAGTPIQWVGTHRSHHQHTDLTGDIHSPLVHGYWVAQSGWYLGTNKRVLSVLYTLAGPFRMLFDSVWRPRTNQQFNNLARDIQLDPFLNFVSRPIPYAALVFLHAIWFYVLGVYLWGFWTIPCIYLTQVSYFFSGDSVNSLLHLKGSQPFTTADNSRNNPWVAFWYFGMGYHNSHHAFPFSANIALLPGQWDSLYSLTRLLMLLGLATDVKTAGPAEIQKKLRRI